MMATMTNHQAAVTTWRDEHALLCSCRPGVLFVGTEDDCARNLAYHEQQAKVEVLAHLVLAQQRERLAEHFSAEQASWEQVQVKEGPVYTKIDRGPERNMSGMLMVENATGEVYGIKGYGRVHRGHHYGNLDTIDQWYWGSYYPQRRKEAGDAS
jgi:hypothetical protein